jgi:hypothetical protein
MTPTVSAREKLYVKPSVPPPLSVSANDAPRAPAEAMFAPPMSAQWSSNRYRACVPKLNARTWSQGFPPPGTSSGSPPLKS